MEDCHIHVTPGHRLCTHPRLAQLCCMWSLRQLARCRNVLHALHSPFPTCWPLFCKCRLLDVSLGSSDSLCFDLMTWPLKGEACNCMPALLTSCLFFEPCICARVPFRQPAARWVLHDRHQQRKSFFCLLSRGHSERSGHFERVCVCVCSGHECRRCDLCGHHSTQWLRPGVGPWVHWIRLCPILKVQNRGWNFTSLPVWPPAVLLSCIFLISFLYCIL